MPRYSLLFLVYFFQLSFAQAQWNSYRGKWVAWQHAPFQLDSLTIEPESIRIDSVSGAFMDLSAYSILFNNQQVVLQYDTSKISSPPDSISISYRVFPINFHLPYFHRSEAAYDSGAYRNLYLEIRDGTEKAGFKKEEVIATSNLQKSGSISRSVAAGNNQDVFLNSALNLQLDGKLTNDVNIKAVITDRNVPFQPEGNTQQLQEFDRVYMELSHRKAMLRAGDILLKNDSSAFLRYNKNVQGGQIGVNLGDSSSKVSSSTQIGGAMAKGQFFNYQMPVREGVLGPYRLQGPNNERNLIVIAGSERVFLDGKPLERGYQHDYIIDYNLAEITFTAQVLITRYSRIRIEFEYATQTYNRSILQARHTQKMGRVAVFGGVYQEKDNPQNPLFFELDEAAEEKLALLGDANPFTLTDAVQPIEEFTPDRVLYTQIDSLVDEVQYTGIWVRAKQTDSTFFQVEFVETGQNAGNYVLERNAENGRNYRWVAPIGGVPQGNFTPGRVLLPPSMKRMVNIGAKVHLSKRDFFFVESAFSTQDKNLLSALDSDDDHGNAFKIGYHNKGKPVSFLKGYQWNAAINFERDSRHFSAIDRFREIEFDRDWSLNAQQPAEDNIFNAGFGLRKDSNNSLRYKLSRRKRESQVDGMQHTVFADKKIGLLQIRNEGFLLENDFQSNRSEWRRWKTDVSLRQKWLVPGYVYAYDRNRVFQLETDSVLRSAMNFEEHLFYLENGDSLKARFRLSYGLREDRIAQEGKMVNADQAETLMLSVDKKGKKTTLRLLLNYRKVRNRHVEGMPVEENLSARLDWRQYLLQKHVYSELIYSTASGQEVRREFVFIRVDNGLGTHTWRDDNEDGVQDLGEFYPALLPDEKNYAKFFVPTTDFLAAFNTNINYRLRVDAPRKWLSAGGIKNLLGRFSLISSVSIRSRTTDAGPQARLVPMFTNIDDTQLLSNNSVIQTSLFFNRKDPKFGIEARAHLAENKQLLTNGFEGRQKNQFALHTRWNIRKGLTWLSELGQGTISSASDFLTDRNYGIDMLSFKSELTYQPATGWRIGATYAYKDKGSQQTDEPIRAEATTFHEVLLKTRWAKGVKASLTGQVRLANIQFVGEENSPIGYELLEALRPGRNITWVVGWIQRLSNGLQLNVAYNGRKSPDQRIAHLGRAQVTALF